MLNFIATTQMSLLCAMSHLFVFRIFLMGFAPLKLAPLAQIFLESEQHLYGEFRLVLG